MHTLDVELLAKLPVHGSAQVLAAVTKLAREGQPATLAEVARVSKLDRRTVLAVLEKGKKLALITTDSHGARTVFFPGFVTLDGDRPAGTDPEQISTGCTNEHGTYHPSDNAECAIVHPAYQTLSDSTHEPDNCTSSVPSASEPEPHICTPDAQIPPAAPAVSRAPTRSSRDLKKEPKERKSLKNGMKRKRKNAAHAARPPRPRLTLDDVQAADPNLPPPIAELRDRILLAGYRRDNITPSQVPKAVEVARWLVAERQATPEQFDRWLTWWWHHPASVGAANQSPPYAANVEGTWDRAFPQVPAPTVLSFPAPVPALTPMQQEAAAYRLRVEARLAAAAQQEETHVELTEIRA
jgi:hypothetical protein